MIRWARRRRGQPSPGLRPTVLHLGFEDPASPNSGGGSRRTYELCRRLGDEFDIVVVTARYPGCAPRRDEPVSYRHIGLNGPYYLRILSYHLCVPWTVWRSRADLIIDDFAAPIASLLVPLWARVPTIASVQWLFARNASREYRLPFFIFESLSVRLHNRFIAVSTPIADHIHLLNPRAEVQVISNGLANEDLNQPFISERRNDILYLGRFQWHAKGLDALFEAFGEILGSCDANLVLVGGGPDAQRVREEARDPRYQGRASVRGWTVGDDKWRLLSTARIVVIPSRYESFGLVALEAMAAGTPVVGFDIPALRELVAADCGILTPSFSVPALAKAMLDLVGDPDTARAIGLAGQHRARGYSWDQAAIAQRAAYHRALSETTG